MSKYEDLRLGFLESKNADIAHWKSLEDGIRDFRKKLCDHLGVPSEERVLVRGKEVPLVVMGAGSRQDFQLVGYSELPRSGKSYDFSLRVAFDAESYDSPSNYAVIRLNIGKIGDELVISELDPIDAHSCTGPDFTSLFDFIFSRLKSTY